MFTLCSQLSVSAAAPAPEGIRLRLLVEVISNSCVRACVCVFGGGATGSKFPVNLALFAAHAQFKVLCIVSHC